MTDKSRETETDHVSTYSIPSGLSYPMARVSVPVWGEACRDCLYIDKDHAVSRHITCRLIKFEVQETIRQNCNFNV